MRAVNRTVLAAILVLGLSLVFAPRDEARAGITAGPAKPTTVTPEADEAAKPAKAAPRGSAEPAGRVMKLDKNTEKKLDRLPASQRILVDGKEMTVGQYELKLKKDQRQAVSKLKARSLSPPVSAEAVQKEFDKKEAARVQAANAKVKAEMAKLGKQPAGAPSSAAAEDIRSEALAIQQRLRAGNATPADDARAKELWEQYQALK